MSDDKRPIQDHERDFYIPPMSEEKVDHPAHYGGADDTYEAIKVIEAWQLNFALGSVIKYIARHGLKPGADALDDLKKARWYINRVIENIEGVKESG